MTCCGDEPGETYPSQCTCVEDGRVYDRQGHDECVPDVYHRGDHSEIYPTVGGDDHGEQGAVTSFHTELTRLINMHGLDTKHNQPDYVVAQRMLDALKPTAGVTLACSPVGSAVVTIREDGV